MNILLLCKRCILKQSIIKESNLNIKYIFFLNGNIELSPTNAFELNPSIQ